MGCNNHLLARHNWSRRVTHTASRPFRETDQWGRAILEDHVVCHAEFVCLACGAVREEGDCVCEGARGNQCAVRLDFIAKSGERARGVNA